MRTSYDSYQVNSAQIIKDYKSKLDYRINFEQEMNQITAMLTKNNKNNNPIIIKTFSKYQK